MSKTKSNIPLDTQIAEFAPIDIEEPSFAIERGPAQTTVFRSASQAFSSSSISWNVTPPSRQTILNRKVMVEVPIRLTMTGTSVGPTLLQIGTSDAPRYAPIQNCLVDTIQVTINNTTFSQRMSDVYDALSRYDSNKGMLLQSQTPAMQDQSQSYANLFGSLRNPLGGYGDSVPGDTFVPRGGFSDISVISDDGSTAVVDLVFTEFLSISPLDFGDREQPGLFGINQFNVVCNIGASGLARCWSHDSVNGENITNIVGSIQANTLLSNPTLILEYYTPRPTEPLPSVMTWPYRNLQVYSKAAGTVNAGASVTITSDSLQLNTVPKRFYFMARRANAARSYNTTDSYLRLDSVSISWDNQSGILSSADSHALYKMSVRNGYKLPWDCWNSNVGSVMCVDLAADIGLRPDIAVGSGGTYQLQIQANFTNVAGDNFDVEMYTMVIDDGVLQLVNDNLYPQIGIVDAMAVLNQKADIAGWEYQDMFNNNDFYGGFSLKKSLKKAKDLAKKGFKAVDDFATSSLGKKVIKGVEDVARAIPGAEGAVDLVDRYGADVYNLAKSLIGSGMIGGNIGMPEACHLIHKQRMLPGAYSRGGGVLGGGVLGGRKKKY